MFKLFNFKQKKIDKLFDIAHELDEQGREEEAIEKYKQVIALDPEYSTCYYNIGLIYKYNYDWTNSFDYNQKAYELNPDSEAARWNLGIAATALRDWSTARKVWHDAGIELDDNDGPINGDFGLNPVRLNPDEDAEVVWAQRIDPARAKIVSVPLPESGYCAGDIVLNDGAPVGYRKYGDDERAVFNVLELFQASALSTFKADVKVSEQSDIDALEKLFEEQGIICEDWTMNYRILCKACSEGRPHDEHDHEGEKEWSAEHEIAIAVTTKKEIENILNEWKNDSTRIVNDLSCVYSRK